MDAWPRPKAAAAELIRAICRDLLEDSGSYIEEITQAAVRAMGLPEIVDDPSLVVEDWRVNHADIIQWLSSNVSRPGQRVEPYIGPQTLEYARDLSRRRLYPDLPGAWRAAMLIAWRRWVKECLDRTHDPAVLLEVLDITARSAVQFAVDSINALDTAVAADADAFRESEARVLATLELVLGGAPLDPKVIEAQLAYKLDQDHTAAVLWADSAADGSRLEECVDALVQTGNRKSLLVVQASAATRWVWLPSGIEPDVDRLLSALPVGAGVHVTIGRPAFGLDGLRSSHAEATAAQRVLIELASPRRVVCFTEVQLVDALTRDRSAAEIFVASTLGELATADAALRKALLTYIQCGFSTSRTAERLFAHRNTVERRVVRANRLTPTKIEDNPAQVAAALLILSLRDPH